MSGLSVQVDITILLENIISIKKARVESRLFLGNMFLFGLMVYYKLFNHRLLAGCKMNEICAIN